MRSQSGSCLGTAVILVALLVLVRFALPGAWRILAVLFTGTFYAAAILFVTALIVLAYFTYKNFKKNQKRKEEQKYAKVERTAQLYRTLISQLQTDILLNRVSAEELLQSEMLMAHVGQDMKRDLVRLKDFISPRQEKILNQELRDYRQQLQQSRDDAVRQVVEENLQMLEEKKRRMEAAAEEIRQKEALVDLVYNRLLNVEEQIKMGKPVDNLFPADLYRRFGLAPPVSSESLQSSRARPSSAFEEDR